MVTSKIVIDKPKKKFNRLPYPYRLKDLRKYKKLKARHTTYKLIKFA